ncbi:hypothetical protein HDU97_003720 [Phlyctochytrium planicorne]|nr:hypothetical protein HDU97_003720 [Phlyctochytrium planicorne]
MSAFVHLVARRAFNSTAALQIIVSDFQSGAKDHILQARTCLGREGYHCCSQSGNVIYACQDGVDCTEDGKSCKHPDPYANNFAAIAGIVIGAGAIIGGLIYYLYWMNQSRARYAASANHTVIMATPMMTGGGDGKTVVMNQAFNAPTQPPYAQQQSQYILAQPQFQYQQPHQ